MLKGNRENVYKLIVDKEAIQFYTQAGCKNVNFEPGDRVSYYLDLKAVESLIEILQQVKRDIVEDPISDSKPSDTWIGPYTIPDIICDQKGTQRL